MENFVCAEDGFVCPIEGFVRAAEGFVCPTEGFVGATEGFLGDFEGFRRPAARSGSAAAASRFGFENCGVLGNRHRAGPRYRPTPSTSFPTSDGDFTRRKYQRPPLSPLAGEAELSEQVPAARELSFPTSSGPVATYFTPGARKNPRRSVRKGPHRSGDRPVCRGASIQHGEHLVPRADIETGQGHVLELASLPWRLPPSSRLAGKETRWRRALFPTRPSRLRLRACFRPTPGAEPQGESAFGHRTPRRFPPGRLPWLRKRGCQPCWNPPSHRYF